MSFLNIDYRRSWGTYKSLYLIIKLVALLTVAVIDPDNCLFRNQSRSSVNVIRQGILLAETTVALVMQSTLAPFIDPASNASEWTSRACYVATSLLGLLAAIDINRASLLTGPILYVLVTPFTS